MTTLPLDDTVAARALASARRCGCHAPRPRRATPTSEFRALDVSPPSRAVAGLVNGALSPRRPVAGAGIAVAGDGDAVPSGTMPSRSPGASSDLFRRFCRSADRVRLGARSAGAPAPASIASGRASGVVRAAARRRTRSIPGGSTCVPVRGTRAAGRSTSRRVLVPGLQAQPRERQQALDAGRRPRFWSASRPIGRADGAGSGSFARATRSPSCRTRDAAGKAARAAAASFVSRRDPRRVSTARRTSRSLARTPAGTIIASSFACERLVRTARRAGARRAGASWMSSWTFGIGGTTRARRLHDRENRARGSIDRVLEEAERDQHLRDALAAEPRRVLDLLQQQRGRTTRTTRRDSQSDDAGAVLHRSDRARELFGAAAALRRRALGLVDASAGVGLWNEVSLTDGYVSANVAAWHAAMAARLRRLSTLTTW